MQAAGGAAPSEVKRTASVPFRARKVCFGTAEPDKPSPLVMGLPLPSARLTKSRPDSVSKAVNCSSSAVSRPPSVPLVPHSTRHEQYTLSSYPLVKFSARCRPVASPWSGIG